MVFFVVRRPLFTLSAGSGIKIRWTFKFQGKMRKMKISVELWTIQSTMAQPGQDGGFPNNEKDKNSKKGTFQ